jgi:hypothetical protein
MALPLLVHGPLVIALPVQVRGIAKTSREEAEEFTSTTVGARWMLIPCLQSRSRPYRFGGHTCQYTPATLMVLERPRQATPSRPDPGVRAAQRQSTRVRWPS